MKAAARALLLCLAASAVHAQTLSPGELGRAHAELEGLSNCTKCHEFGEQLDGKKCMECHTTLQKRVADGRGMHARQATKEKGCLECHNEHRGESAALAEWGGPKEKFDHGRTGWDLHGKHSKAKCTACHDARLVDADVRKRFNATGDMTWLGLRRTCTECHFDEHRGTLKGTCQSCHDERGFKPAPGFKHNEHFRLRGAHARAACTGCHASVPDPSPRADAYLPPVHANRFTKYPTNKRDCVDCHKDPHDGKFGVNCAKCHNERNWHATLSPDREAGFHDRSNFPLEGKHREVSCENCHPKNPKGGMVLRGFPYANCSDCHADAHQGQLTRADESASRCERCHDEDGFAPARYPVADHASTRFALTGAHALVACNECHVERPRAERARDLPRLVSHVLFQWPGKDFTRCETCHADPHDGQFKRSQPPRSCEQCHQDPDSFARITFDHSTAWPLEGPHADARCTQCHQRADAKAPVEYQGTPRTCSSCHSDVHQGQFQRPGEEATDCLRCHAAGAFKPSPFVHGDARFSAFELRGRHSAVACSGCHPQRRSANGEAFTWYVGLPTRCDGCHQDAHDGRTP